MPVVLTKYRALVTRIEPVTRVGCLSLRVIVTVAAGRQLNKLAATRAARAKTVI